MLTNEAVAALQALAQTTTQLHQLAHAHELAVDEARSAGASWASIANIVGVSKQAIAKKHTRRPQHVDRTAALF